MMLLSECRVFVNEVRMMWWCCWVSVVFLWMKWGWCDDVAEWVSCVCVWSAADVIVYEVLIEFVCLLMKWGKMRWCYYVSVVCLCMKWGWCDDVVERVSCVCVCSEDDVMILFEWVSCVWVWNVDDVLMLLSECHAFVYEVRMMRWSCWMSVMCLSMKWGWCDDLVEVRMMW